MASSTALILKVVSLVLLFVVTVVGCHAHFDSVMKELWDTQGFPELCKADPSCPDEAIPMERTFVALTIICLILSTISVIAGFVMDAAKIKVPDGGYHILAGVLILIAGILLIAATIKVDDVTNFNGLNSRGLGAESLFGKGLMTRVEMRQQLDVQKEIRKLFKYSNKLAAGALAVIDGLLYFATAAVIFKS